MLNISLAFGFLFSWAWYYFPVQITSLYMARAFDIGVVLLTAILAYAFLKIRKVRNNNLFATILIALGNVILASRIMIHTYHTFYPQNHSSVEAIMEHAQGNLEFYVNVARMPATIIIIVGLILAFTSNKRLKHDAQKARAS